MAEDLLRPQVPRPLGLPPKRLVITLFASLCLAVLVIAFFSAAPAEPMTAAERARLNAARLTEQDRSAIGSAAMDVRNAAERSGLPAQFRTPPAEPPASAPAFAPLPVRPFAAAPAAASLPAGPPERDPGEIARELEALNSRIAILDVDPAAQAGSVASLLQGTAEVQAPAGHAVAARPSVELAAQAAADWARRLDAPAPSSPSPEREFRAQVASVRAQAALRPQPPESRFVVMEGAVIPAVLLRDIVSDLPGVLTAVVSEDVYDTVSARHLLVCKGARLVGQYSSDVQQGQSRLLFAFTRLVLRDGTSFDLGGFDGSDAAGQAGVTGEVDRHFLRIYGSALLTGLLADRVTRAAVVPRGDHAQRSATGEVLVDAAADMLRRSQNLAPTIRVPRGTPILVEVRRDLAFPPPAGRSCA